MDEIERLFQNFADKCITANEKQKKALKDKIDEQRINLTFAKPLKYIEEHFTDKKTNKKYVDVTDLVFREDEEDAQNYYKK